MKKLFYVIPILMAAIASSTFTVFAHGGNGSQACSGGTATQSCTWYVDASGNVWAVSASGRTEHSYSQTVTCTAGAAAFNGAVTVANNQQGYTSAPPGSRCGTDYFSVDPSGGSVCTGWNESETCGSPLAAASTPLE